MTLGCHLDRRVCVLTRQAVMFLCDTVSMLCLQPVVTTRPLSLLPALFCISTQQAMLSPTRHFGHVIGILGSTALQLC